MKFVVSGLLALALLVGSPVGAQEAAPEFKPGIPGLKMADVREHKHLWREIEELQSWERSERITVAEYRAKVIEKTTVFLGFGGDAATAFSTLAAQSVTGLREAFAAGRKTDIDPSRPDSEFAAELTATVERVTSKLSPEPRHQLFVPDVKKWLLRLAFGPSEAKEAKETAAASQPAGS
jgi:hypothetical protein